MGGQVQKVVAAALAGMVIVGAALFAVQPALADVTPITMIALDVLVH